MAVDSIRLPDDVEQGASFGPDFSTTILKLASGKEQRNQNWTRQLCSGDISYGIQSKDDFNVVKDFFYARRGRLRGFLFKDWSDFESATAEAVGTGDGSNKVFQLVKAYDDDVLPFSRIITRPVADTLSIFDNGTLVSTGYSLGDLGVVTFVTAPTTGHAITAQFEFDVPVRFDTDEFKITLDQIEAGEVQSLPIQELPE